MKKTPSRRADGLIPLHFRYKDMYGISRSKHVYGKTLKEAERKKADFLADVKAGLRISQSAKTTAEWADEWLLVSKKPVVSIRTYETYAHDVELIKQAIGHKPLKTVTPSDLQKIVNTRNGLSASAIRKTLMTIRAVFKAAIENRLISLDPCTGLKKVPGPSGTHRALTEDEISAILKTALCHKFGPVAALMLLAGLRRGEAAAFDFDTDVVGSKLVVNKALTWPSNQAVVKEPKSKAGTREIPILSPMNLYIKKGLALKGENGYYSEVAFRNAYKSFVKASGVDFKCHDLRHTFCTMIYDAGVDVKTAQQWLGHDDPTVTFKIYTHLSESRKQTSSEDAEEHFRKRLVVKLVVNS